MNSNKAVSLIGFMQLIQDKTRRLMVSSEAYFATDPGIEQDEIAARQVARAQAVPRPACEAASAVGVKAMFQQLKDQA